MERIINIQELLSENRIDYRTEGHEHCRSGWIQIDCPFCSPDSNRFRMGIHIKHIYANCWHCGYKSLPYLLRKLLPRLSAKEILNLSKQIKPERLEEKSDHFGTYQEPRGVKPLLAAHRRYLQERGFDVSQVEQLWAVQGIGVATQLQWRLFIPILYHSQIVSWTTRSIGDTQRGKYISASPEEESILHKHLLYGEDYCRHSIVICEGPLDVWAIGPGAVATFGMDCIAPQIERIVKYPIRAICFDNEPDAQSIARKLANNLSAFPGETHNIVLDSKDPGEAKQREIRRIRKEILE